MKGYQVGLCSAGAGVPVGTLSLFLVCPMLLRQPRIYFFSRLDPSDLWQQALTEQLGADVPFDFVVGPECEDPASIDIGLMYSLPPQGLLAFTGLRAVLSLSAGVNQFDRSRLPADVPLVRSVDPSLAEHMVAYARAAVYRYQRRFHHFERLSRERRWQFELPRLPKQTAIGVLGLGALGCQVAQALHADGFEVHGWSASAKHIQGVHSHNGAAGLRDMTAQVNMLINLLPLTAQTEGILNRRLFEQLRPGAFLINMGRGAHLVEEDLVGALANGQIEAATLDVTQCEPLPPEHPLWAHPQILITPHVAGISTPATACVGIADNIRRLLQGRPLLNQVDPGRGY
jgi:glyoxylate/hydroxypyruvate reductase A